MNDENPTPIRSTQQTAVDTLPAPLRKAFDSDNLTVTTIDVLLSDGGAPLASTDTCLTVVPVVWGRTRLQPEEDDGVAADFESSEHVILAEDLMLPFSNQRVEQGLTHLFTLPNGLRVTYGQIIALAGDFYSSPSFTISTDKDPRESFVAAFESLANDPAAVDEATAILEVLQKEFAAVQEALRQGKEPSEAYAELGDSLSCQWNEITGGACIGGEPFPLGRYLQIAEVNWDHFGPFAELVYTVGHEVAMNAAALATSDDELALAYAINAFADHYLTDLFSAGHIRTPRKRMYDDASVVTRPAASLCAREMHDEDSRNGLWVTNRRGDRWVAYGDKRYRDAVNYLNVAVIKAALQASVDDVYNSFLQQKPLADPTALGFLPRLDSSLDDRFNYSPLFVADPDIELRSTQTNLLDYRWTPNFLYFETLIRLLGNTNRRVGVPLVPTVPWYPNWIDPPTGAPPSALAQFGWLATGPATPTGPPTGLGAGGPTGPAIPTGPSAGRAPGAPSGPPKSGPTLPGPSIP